MASSNNSNKPKAPLAVGLVKRVPIGTSPKGDGKGAETPPPPPPPSKQEVVVLRDLKKLKVTDDDDTVSTVSTSQNSTGGHGLG